MEHTTIFTQLKDSWIRLIWEMRPEITLSIIQAGFIVFIATGIAFIAWLRFPMRSVLSQVLVLLFCVVFGLNYPLDHIRVERYPGNYVLIVTVCLLFIIFLPGRMTFFLTPRLRHQMIVARIITSLIWLLLFIQFFI